MELGLVLPGLRHDHRDAQPGAHISTLTPFCRLVTAGRTCIREHARCGMLPGGGHASTGMHCSSDMVL